MKKRILFFITLMLIANFGYAQTNDGKLYMRMTIQSDSFSVVLNYSDLQDKAIEGYFLLPRYKDVFTPNAAFRKGGFSFLDPVIAGGFSFLASENTGGFIELLSKDWVKNHFPLTDIAPLTNGLMPAKVLSFKIKPIIVEENSDTLHLLVKYAMIDYWDNIESDLSLSPHVQLFYRLLHFKYNETAELKDFEDLFKGYTFKAEFRRKGNDSYKVGSEELFDAIKESAKESEIGDVDFLFGVSLVTTNSFDKTKINYINKHQEVNLPAAKAIAEEEVGERYQLPAKIYYGKLQFPFVLYNKEKAKRYASYKTKEKIFQSTYNIVIVPIKITGDSLTYDLFLNYSKLNLGDGIPRWTPIKKRITVARDRTFAEIALPKENWSANFTRGGERYDIYGYSDFEQFVDEKLWIKVKISK